MIRPTGRALLRLARPYRWVMPAIVSLGILASLAEGLGIGLLIPVLDEVMAARDAGHTPGAMTQALRDATDWIPAEYHLAVLAAAILALVGLKTTILIANTGITSWISGRITHDLRVMIAERLLNSDYAFVTRLKQGTLVNLLETQTYRVGEAVTLLANFISAACTVLVFAILLALLSWKLALVVVAVILPVSLFVRMMARRSRRLGNTLLQAHSRLSARLIELVGSLRTIRLFNGEAAEAARIAATSEEVRRETLRTELVTGAIQPVSEFLYVPVFLGVLAYSLGAGIALPTLLAFMALLYRLQTPLKQLDHVRVALSSYSAAVEEIDELRLQADRRPGPSGARVAPAIAHAIEFEHVGFAYEGASGPTLEDVSFEIRRGEVVAISGASGAGKSTLVNLLCKLYEPSSGRILVDGVPLAELDTRMWRSRIGLAGQDADLLEGSIRDNVALGDPAATQDEIAQAVQEANAADFLRELPSGLDAPVGPRGQDLSGGQRQRIALARAFVRRPDLLILDEATNAVDNVTEAEIQQAIDALAGKCTILVIAHRLGTLRRADRIVVLDAGRIVEQGVPEDLLRSGGQLARQHALE